MEHLNDIKIKIERVPRYRGFRLFVLPNSSVILRCSKKIPQDQINQFVAKNLTWLKRSLARSQELQMKYPKLSFLEGENYRFLGENYTLKFQKIVDKKPIVQLATPFMIIGVPENQWRADFSMYPHPQLQKVIFNFYLQAAQRVLPKRVEELSKILGLRPTNLSLRKQKTLWGSCSRQGSIQLNWKLISAPLNVIDYVIIHELVHLKHPNHSKAFWSEVEKFCPDYKRLRLWLKKNYFSFDNLNEISELHMSKL